MVYTNLRRLMSVVPVCALVFSTGAAQAQQSGGATTLFNNVRVFDGKGTALSEPTNVLVKGNLIEESPGRRLRSIAARPRRSSRAADAR